MSTYNTAVTRTVKRHMQSLSISQKALANDLAMSQTALSQRMRGAARWQLDDLDRLIQLGFPIGLDVFGAAVNEEYAHKESK